MWTEIDSRHDDIRDGAEQRAHRVMEALRRAQLAEKELRARTARAMGVSETEVMALRLILRRQQQGEPATPTDVAHYLGVRSTAVTLLADHLEAAGYVERQPHPSDRRRLVLIATDAGAASIGQLFADVYGTMMAAAERLDETSAARIEAFLDELTAALGSLAGGEPEHLEVSESIVA